MKLYQFFDFQSFYVENQNKKMPIKTAYKLANFTEQAKKEIEFYQKTINQILDECAQKDENGNPIKGDAPGTILLIKEKEKEAQDRIKELEELDIEIKPIFTIDEIETFDITLRQLENLKSLIIK